MPIETILLGANNTKERRLTAKQIKFAEEVAKGQTKAEAYRKAYKSKGKPKTQSNEGQKLTKDQAIATQIEAFKVALEAQKYQTPLHLRALTIHKLTEKVLDPNCPPAQQIKAMELLGKITEVALFTERREVVQISDSKQMKEKLLASLSLAIKSSGATDVNSFNPEDLLAELKAEPVIKDITPDLMLENDSNIETDDDQSMAEGSFNSDSADPTDPQPPKIQISHGSPVHSNPHTQSHKNSVTNTPHLQPVDLQEDSTVTPVTHRVNPNVTQEEFGTHSRGEGVVENLADELESELRTPPVNVSKS